MVLRRELLEKWFVKLAALYLFVIDGIRACAEPEGADEGSNEFIKNMAIRQATRRGPLIRVFLNDGRRQIPVTSYYGQSGETLERSLGKVHARFTWDRRYADFLTDFAIGLKSAHCSKDPRGNRTVGEGSRQLVFYVNGVAFRDKTVKTQPIPESSSVSIVVAVEPYDQRKANDGVFAFLYILTGAPV